MAEGKWIFHEYIYDWICSECGYCPEVDDFIIGPRLDICPKCQAKMKNPGEVMRRLGNPIKEKVVDKIE